MRLQNQPPYVLFKKAVLNNFTMLKGKPLGRSLFLIKLQIFRLHPYSTVLPFKSAWTLTGSEVYIGPCRTSVILVFVKIVNDQIQLFSQKNLTIKSFAYKLKLKILKNNFPFNTFILKVIIILENEKFPQCS